MSIFDILALAFIGIVAIVICLIYFIDWSIDASINSKYEKNKKDLKARRDKLQW